MNNQSLNKRINLTIFSLVLMSAAPAYSASIAALAPKGTINQSKKSETKVINLSEVVLRATIISFDSDIQSVDEVEVIKGVHKEVDLDNLNKYKLKDLEDKLKQFKIKRAIQMAALDAHYAQLKEAKDGSAVLKIELSKAHQRRGSTPADMVQFALDRIYGLKDRVGGRIQSLTEAQDKVKRALAATDELKYPITGTYKWVNGELQLVGETAAKISADTQSTSGNFESAGVSTVPSVPSAPTTVTTNNAQ